MMLSLANAILQGDIANVRAHLRHGAEINELDEYGYTPLIEAAIINNTEISQLLLQAGAYPNSQDIVGGTALQWAVENNNLALAKLLLQHQANPNSYNFAGLPVLAMPILRQQSSMRQLLLQAGADQTFAEDFINTKLLGHMFELVGVATIVSPQNQFVEVDFEGFFLEVTLGLIADALLQFQNHFAARQLRRFSGLTAHIARVLQRALQLIRYQQYQVDEKKYDAEINEILAQEPVLIPVGYEGHAITFIRSGQIWIKCDRREDSRLYDNIVFYHIQKPENMTNELVKSLIYTKQSSRFINEELDKLLGLSPITELKVNAQISGNCSWANVEAVIPALFFLTLAQSNPDTSAHAYYKTLALNFFQRWREWNKDRALHFCVRSFETGDKLRKASKAEILAAILFQLSYNNKAQEYERIELILSVLLHSPYEYILRNYVRVYYYEGHTDEGKAFFHLLQEHGLALK